MRADQYLWLLLTFLFSSLGAYLLADSVQHSGPYAEAWILLGGALAALGLTALYFAFQRQAQVQRLAQHMRRRSFYPIQRSPRNKISVVPRELGSGEVVDEK